MCRASSAPCAPTLTSASSASGAGRGAGGSRRRPRRYARVPCRAALQAGRGTHWRPAPALTQPCDAASCLAQLHGRRGLPSPQPVKPVGATAPCPRGEPTPAAAAAARACAAWARRSGRTAATMPTAWWTTSPSRSTTRSGGCVLGCNCLPGCQFPAPKPFPCFSFPLCHPEWGVRFFPPFFTPPHGDT